MKLEQEHYKGYDIMPHSSGKDFKKIDHVVLWKLDGVVVVDRFIYRNDGVARCLDDMMDELRSAIEKRGVEDEIDCLFSQLYKAESIKVGRRRDLLGYVERAYRRGEYYRAVDYIDNIIGTYFMGYEEGDRKKERNDYLVLLCLRVRLV